MAPEFEGTTDLETLVEEAYQAELAAWQRRKIDWELFDKPNGPSDTAMVLDALLVWVPLFFLAQYLPQLGGTPPIDWTGPLMCAFAATVVIGGGWAKLKAARGSHRGIGPFGWIAHRKYLREAAIPCPVRLDPWSTEAIRKAVAYTQRKIRTEQEATLGRVWEAKVESGNALHAARDMRDRLTEASSGTLLQAARLDALDRLIARHEELLSDLDEQERIANETPRPVLATLETLEDELTQRDALEVLLQGEERARLLEAETAAIRQSVTGLVDMVRQCESSLHGLARDLQSRDSAEEEIRLTLGEP